MQDYLATQINQLFRGRPFTKAVPFNKVFTGVIGQSHDLWLPQNAFFELAGGHIMATAVIEVYLADGSADFPIAFIVPATTTYTQIVMPQATYRSSTSHGPKLLLVDATGVAATVKGVLYGWEVTQEGNYR